MVYYRTYRPKTISELDSQRLRETFYSVLKGAVQNTDPAAPVRQADSLASAQSVPHAFLFTGPKGLGKTSTARIIAKVLNCEHIDLSSVSGRQPVAKDPEPKTKDQIEPDNICSQC